MNLIKIIVPCGMIAMLLFHPQAAEAVLHKGDAAPKFAQIESPKKKPMTILYFFKVGSNPSRGGLDHLKELYVQHQKEGVGVVAISSDERGPLDTYLEKNPLPYPVIRDDGKLFKSYQVKVILPVIYLLGPSGQISDVFEGWGGEIPQVFLTTVAGWNLQMNRTAMAGALYESVLKSDPQNITAQKGIGDVYLREGKLDRAEAEYTKIARRKSPEAIIGKAGLAEVHLKRGDAGKARAIADEVEKEQPDSGLVHLIKGNVLAAQGRSDGALSEFKMAAAGKRTSDKQVAEAYNAAGRIHSERGEYPLAEKMYQEAVAHNPYSPEILSNRGVLYEKQGKPQKALALYQEALGADPNDEIAQGLMKRIERNLAFKEDMERQKRIDTLVADLSDRYQKGQVTEAPAGDGWSSKPLTFAFVGLQSIGGGLLREGMTDVVEQEITQGLMTAGRVKVVEREILDKLLAELKIGSSDLADRETALKLGKLLAARLITTGSLVQVPKGVRLSLRVIDPETSAIRLTYSDETDPGKGLTAFAEKTSEVLNHRIQEEYPLKGKIASVEGEDKVIINLGSNHGVKQGTRLRIIEEGDPIVVDGKTIGHKKKTVGLIQVTEVEEMLSYGKVIERQDVITKEQRVLEVPVGDAKGL